MRHYANKSTKTAHYVHYDQGDILCIEVIIAFIVFNYLDEDRWLTTSLLQQGYRS